MPKYETVIHVINEGDNRFEAGEMAGAIIDGFRVTGDMILFCEPTRVYSNPLQSIVDPSSEKYLVEA